MIWISVHKIPVFLISACHRFKVQFLFQQNFKSKKMRKFLLVLSIFSATVIASMAQTGTVRGITAIVNYSDIKYNSGKDTVEQMINQFSGFSQWGNNGSVREYFYKQSDGKLDLWSYVVEVTVSRPFFYYHHENDPSYDGGQELAKEVVGLINAQYPQGFSNLTVHPTDNRLWYFSIISRAASRKGFGVAYGLGNNLKIKNNGTDMRVRHVAVTSTDGRPEINTICHELGHNVLGLRDYYNVNHSVATNLGHYCLMGSGGRRGSPMHISPAFRVLKGWVDDVKDITNDPTQTYTATSNDYGQVYKYTNTSNPQEYLLIEPYIHSQYYLNRTGDGYIPDQGLAIWYVDGGRGNSRSPYIKLVQADGMDEMHDLAKTHRDHRGDATDLFDNIYNEFSDATHPFRWKDGSETGLNISEVSPFGPTMTFKVNKGGSLLSTFDVPRTSGIPNGFKKYSHVHTIGSGGPDLSHVFNSVFNWWGNQWNPNGLYQFTLETTNGNPRHYTNIPDFGSYQLFNAAPEITIYSSIGFAGMAGSYWVNTDGDNLVLVEKSGGYALYFSNSASAPNVRVAKNGIAEESILTGSTEDLVMPNPFTYETKLVIPEEMGEANVTITDLSGRLVDSFIAAGTIKFGAEYEAGTYLVKINSGGMVKQSRFVKQ